MRWNTFKKQFCLLFSAYKEENVTEHKLTVIIKAYRSKFQTLNLILLVRRKYKYNFSIKFGTKVADDKTFLCMPI
jgi:hypothetical protein